jgi:predicted DNA binding CopG/RHH family protein
MSFFPSPSFSLSKKRKKNKNNSSKKINNDNDDNNMVTTPIVNDNILFRSTHYGLGYHLDSTPIVDTYVNNDLIFERRVLKSPTKPLQQDIASDNTTSINSLGHSHLDDVDDNNNNYNINRLHNIPSPSSTNHLSQQRSTSDHSHHHHHHHDHDQSKFSTETKRRRSSALLHFIRGFVSPESMNIQRYVSSVVLQFTTYILHECLYHII